MPTTHAGRDGGRAALGLALSLVVVGLTAGLAGAATATTSPAPTSPAAPVMPVVPMVAPVYPLVSPIKDLAGIATVDERPDSVDVRLDANVLFAKDSAEIKAAGAARLREVATQIEARGPGTLHIDGYTDDLGSAAHGLKLSKRRAEAVADELRPQLPGDSYRFVVRGRGETDFVVPNTSEENRRKNRRVEIHAVPDEAADR